MEVCFALSHLALGGAANLKLLKQRLLAKVKGSTPVDTMVTLPLEPGDADVTIHYLGSRHMLLGLGTVWLRPKRAGARAFCAHERAGAHTSVRVSERVSARVRA